MKKQDKTELLKKLAEPFAPHLVQYKPTLLRDKDGYFKENGVALAGCMSYIDARQVRQRLDEVFPLAWSTNNSMVRLEYSTTETREDDDGNIIENKYNKPKKFPVKDHAEGVVCTLTLYFEDGTSISRQDVGTPSYSDPAKGAYSDSFKRAAVKFGVGEHLYTNGTYMIPYAYGEWKNITLRDRVKVQELGLEFYGDRWNDSERERICQTMSNNRKGCYHVEELTEIEGSKLVSGLKKKIATRDSEKS